LIKGAKQLLIKGAEEPIQENCQKHGKKYVFLPTTSKSNGGFLSPFFHHAAYSF